MLKKILIILVLMTVVILSGCGKKKEEAPKDLLDTIKARGKIIVGVKTDTKPFGFLDKDGKNIGYDIDIAKKICYLIFGNEEQIEFVPVTPSNRIMKLSSGAVDILVATMSVTSQRRPGSQKEASIIIFLPKTPSWRRWSSGTTNSR